MKNSDYFLLVSNIFLAQTMGKGWAWAMWAFNFAGFAVFFYLERS